MELGDHGLEHQAPACTACRVKVERYALRPLKRRPRRADTSLGSRQRTQMSERNGNASKSTLIPLYPFLRGQVRQAARAIQSVGYAVRTSLFYGLGGGRSAPCEEVCFFVGNKKPSHWLGFLKFGAQEKTRTSTTVKSLIPETSASTNSATWAQKPMNHHLLRVTTSARRCGRELYGRAFTL